MTEQRECWCQSCHTLDALTITGLICSEGPERLSQPLTTRPQVQIHEHITCQQHPVALPPEAQMAGRVTGQFQHLESADLIAFSQPPDDGICRTTPELCLKMINERAGMIRLRHHVGLSRAGPQRQVQRQAQRGTGTLMI